MQSGYFAELLYTGGNGLLSRCDAPRYLCLLKLDESGVVERNPIFLLIIFHGAATPAEGFGQLGFSVTGWCAFFRRCVFSSSSLSISVTSAISFSGSCSFMASSQTSIHFSFCLPIIVPSYSEGRAK